MVFPSRGAEVIGRRKTVPHNRIILRHEDMRDHCQRRSPNGTADQMGRECSGGGVVTSMDRAIEHDGAA